MTQSKTIIVLLSMAMSACVSIRPIDVTQPFELAEDEGLLIIDIDTELRVKTAYLGSSVILTDSEKGRHIKIVRARAGSYRWGRINIPSPFQRPYRYRLSRLSEYEIKVKAGKLNYGGQLVIVASNKASGWWGPDLIVRNRNRAAMTLRAMSAMGSDYDTIMQRFPLHHAGSSRDLFLDYYQRLRDRLESVDPIEASTVSSIRPNAEIDTIAPKTPTTTDRNVANEPRGASDP